ncbi:nitroreductase family protein [Cobetia amphilecti]|nr:nitroreductase family protein [Cobetia litoralis]
MLHKLSRIFKIFTFVIEYMRDFKCFIKHNGFSPFEPLEKRLSNKTIIEAHTVEKGLSLPNPKPYFGQNKVRDLLSMNSNWTPPKSDLSRTMLLGALRDYVNEFNNIPPPDQELLTKVKKFIKVEDIEAARGGVKLIDKNYISYKPEVISFLENRHSSRNFSDVPLSNDDIESVIRLSQAAPSQCNRQASRVHVFRDKKVIKNLLDLQSGARGFSDVVPTLFVITSELTAWGGPQQRNQPYVDGGIFSNMLLLSLSAHGFVNCPLNLALLHDTENKIKAVGNIPARERLILMVAAGTPPDTEIKAANSPRWDSSYIYKIHDGDVS